MGINTPREAELAAASFMRHSLGYVDAQATAATNDGGIDVASAQAVAQVKLHMKPTGRPDLQRLFGANAHGGREMLFFSFSGYSPKAIAYGDSVGMALFQFNFEAEYFTVNSAAVQIVRRKEQADKQAARERKAAQEREEQAAAARAREKAAKQQQRAREDAQRARDKDAQQRQRAAERAQAKQERAEKLSIWREEHQKRAAMAAMRRNQQRQWLARVLPPILYRLVGVAAVLAALFCALLLAASLSIDETGPKVTGLVFGALGFVGSVYLARWAFRRGTAAAARARTSHINAQPPVLVVMRCPACGMQNRAPSGSTVRCGSCRFQFRISVHR